MPRPSRSTLMMPMSAQSSLSHWTTTRPGMVAGSSGTTESSCPWQITMPPECWPRWRGRSCDSLIQLQKFAHARIARGRSRPRETGARACRWDPSIPTPAPGSDRRSSVADFEAQRLADFARGRAAAIGDDVGGHGRAQLAVALVDVLDGALALIAAGQVEIDIRPLAALFGEEALEQQVHAHRIDGGDSQRITDRAVGGRAAPLRQNAVVAAETHDVPDDQEIAGQFQLFDQRQLALDLPPRLLVIGLVAPPRAFIRALAQERLHGFARRHGIARKFVAQIGQREFQARGNFRGVARWLRADRRTAAPSPRRI